MRLVFAYFTEGEGARKVWLGAQGMGWGWRLGVFKKDKRHEIDDWWGFGGGGGRAWRG